MSEMPARLVHYGAPYEVPRRSAREPARIVAGDNLNAGHHRRARRGWLIDPPAPVSRAGEDGPHRLPSMLLTDPFTSKRAAAW